MLCDTGSGVNIMAAVTYQLLFGTMPLKPTYIQLQMADRKVEDKYDPSIILRRTFLSTVKAIIYIGTREVHMHFTSEKVRRCFTDPNYIVEDSKQVRTRRRRRNSNLRRQIIKDGWADYEGEVVSRISVRGNLTDVYDENTRTQAEASDSTLYSVVRTVLDGQGLEHGKSV